MIWYVLGTVIVVFGGVALLISLALSSNRVASTQAQAQPQPAQQQPQGDSDWKKWGERIGWGFFGLILFDVYKKIFGSLPIEWKEWIPSFSWNTFEILALVAGVVVLWGKWEKKPTATGSGTGASGSVEQGGEAGVPCNHLSPAQIRGTLYAAPQVKWIRTGAESFWIAFAIFAMVCLVFGGAMYASGGSDILAGFWTEIMEPVHLSRGVMVLLFTAVIYPYISESNRVLALISGILSVIIGSAVYGWGWFAVPLGIQIPWWGTTLPAVFVALPIILISIQALWKSFWSDWITPGYFAVIWFVFIVLIQDAAMRS